MVFAGDHDPRTRLKRRARRERGVSRATSVGSTSATSATSAFHSFPCGPRRLPDTSLSRMSRFGSRRAAFRTGPRHPAIPAGSSTRTTLTSATGSCADTIEPDAMTPTRSDGSRSPRARHWLGSRSPSRARTPPRHSGARCRETELLDQHLPDQEKPARTQRGTHRKLTDARQPARVGGIHADAPPSNRPGWRRDRCADGVRIVPVTSKASSRASAATRSGRTGEQRLRPFGAARASAPSLLITRRSRTRISANEAGE